MKIGIVTGASSGFGKEFVKQLDIKYELDEIWIVARREDRLIELAKEVKTTVRIFALDLSKSDSWDALENAVRDSGAEVKILINNAGYGKFGAFSNIDNNVWQNMIDLNDKALVALTHKILPFMNEGSEIMNIASAASFQPVPYIDVYAATKAFVLAFSRGLNIELKPRKIKVIAVCPFWTKTEFLDVAEKSEDKVIRYYSSFDSIENVVKKALKNVKKGKDVSIAKWQIKLQCWAVRVLPNKFVMKVWCKQQKFPLK